MEVHTRYSIVEFFVVPHIRLSILRGDKGLDVSITISYFEPRCTYVLNFLLCHILWLFVLRGGRGVDVTTRFLDFELRCT